MDNYKIKVKDEAESKEAQELFFELGYSNRQSKRFGFVYTQNGEIGCDSMEHWAYYNDLCKELTLPQLRDLVVLKRNDVKDATHEDQYGDKWLYLDERHYVYLNDQWDLPIGEFLERYELKPILPVKNQDPALISGADALRALADGKEVEANNSDFAYWIDARNLGVKDFFDDIHIFRLKPQTIKVELELPKPFEPKVGEEFWTIVNGSDGYACSNEIASRANTFGAWRTEEEIKQVVEQLRKIRGTNS
ncbi:hypothetical protein [Acinetobacter baumannii]|uniref:hypothetical protein n=1 Tax=Acinetobacter baumannii TaxID=470 RepID=UPI00321BE97C|nr:hypothetical protein [Acinetobacter baumannii]